MALDTPYQLLASPAQPSMFLSLYSVTTHMRFLIMNLFCGVHFTNPSCFLHDSNHCKAQPAQPLPHSRECEAVSIHRLPAGQQHPAPALTPQGARL